MKQPFLGPGQSRTLNSQAEIDQAFAADSSFHGMASALFKAKAVAVEWTCDVAGVHSFAAAASPPVAAPAPETAAAPAPVAETAAASPPASDVGPAPVPPRGRT